MDEFEKQYKKALRDFLVDWKVNYGNKYVTGLCDSFCDYLKEKADILDYEIYYFRMELKKEFGCLEFPFNFSEVSAGGLSEYKKECHQKTMNKNPRRMAWIESRIATLNTELEGEK